MLTLASDFGSPYPAAMKGVLLRRTDARLVDVAHDLPRQDVRAAAFWLREMLPWFPPAVHLAVVDPGVGTDRRALVVRAGDHALVGPDNGSLLPPARRIAAAGGDEPTPLGDDSSTSTRDPASSADGDDSRALDAYVVDDADAASSTFHGRDVFAPAAAAAHEAGVDALGGLDRLTPVPLADVADCRLPEAALHPDGADGEVLVVDDFGNVVTNVPGSALGDRDAVLVNDERVPVGETFAAVPAGERLVTVGSHGYVECDVNRGRGDEAFGLAPGDPVALRWSVS